MLDRDEELKLLGFLATLASLRELLFSRESIPARFCFPATVYQFLFFSILRLKILL
jgi:hypothetical protein